MKIRKMERKRKVKFKSHETEVWTMFNERIVEEEDEKKEEDEEDEDEWKEREERNQLTN